MYLQREGYGILMYLISWKFGVLRDPRPHHAHDLRARFFIIFFHTCLIFKNSLLFVSGHAYHSLDGGRREMALLKNGKMEAACQS